MKSTLLSIIPSAKETGVKETQLDSRHLEEIIQLDPGLDTSDSQLECCDYESRLNWSTDNEITYMKKFSVWESLIS